MSHHHSQHCHCCPQVSDSQKDRQSWDLSRRMFLGAMAAGGALLSHLGWSALAATSEEIEIPVPPARKPLTVCPILAYDHYIRQEMTSWRGWGGVTTPEDAEKEVLAIGDELEKIRKDADYPVEFEPVITVNDVNQAKEHPSIAKADVLVVYGAGGAVNGIQNFGKDVIIFQRWKSGPVYLQYEIVSPRLLRQHTDRLALDNIRYDDIVTDSLDELNWRLRALCGLKNTKNSRILCIGAPDAWAQGAESQKILFDNLKKQWNLDIQSIPYDQLGELLAGAQADEKVVQWSREKAEEYIRIPNTTVDKDVTMESIANCFILEYIFCKLMKEADCKAITVLGCMTTIIPQAKTTACLTLSLLNDAGYLAFCESDFAVIPSGILLANITGKPVFLNDPTYPHDHIITLAHCTAPRKLNGETLAPTQVVTHYESDFGAAPKIEFALNQTGTAIIPDFHSVRWAGCTGKVVDNPFRPICRCQFDFQYNVPDLVLAERMIGFHWMFCYGDFTKELGYVLRRVGIEWDNLENAPLT